ncbi:hypothetical protein GCM10011358_03130 [Sinisalibacter lacisalsi]|uniref:Rhodanese domain-containing protein n=1 Tax=Sinisalibacter lacisalsi TaxID=1526570 RepID=A0ABQ1QBG4_9RHOB|nr:hypothetical protein GCM10011358_03130 [Sinisalibacter lacisalsi]
MGLARPSSGKGAGSAAPALLAALTLGAPGALSADPVSRVGALPETGAVAVLDIRAEADCLAGSLPDARCLPAAWMLDDGAGRAIGFSQLRWLLGTVGLSGRETLVIYDGAEKPTNEAWAVAALVHLAGQAEVSVLEGRAETGRNGWPRAFSREQVFTAPMNLAAMTLDAEGAGPTVAALSDFARGRVATVAFAPET